MAYHAHIIYSKQAVEKDNMTPALERYRCHCLERKGVTSSQKVSKVVCFHGNADSNPETARGGYHVDQWGAVCHDRVHIWEGGGGQPAIGLYFIACT